MIASTKAGKYGKIIETNKNKYYMSVETNEIPAPNLPPESQRELALLYEKIPEEERRGNELLRREIYRLLKLNDEQIHRVERDLQELEESSKISTYNEDEREWEWKVIDMVRYVKKWPLPPLSEWENPTDSIEVVVHPLYGLFVTQWNSALWESCNGDVDKYISEKLKALANETFEELKKDPTCFPHAYFIMRDVLEELDALRTPPQPGQLRVLDLPRRSMLSNERIKAYDLFLKTLPPQQTVIMDSMHPGTGTIQGEDLEHMKNIIASNGVVEFQGGYINACIDAAVGSFIRSVSDNGREDISLFVDTDPSTAMIAERTGVSTKLEREKQVLQAEKGGNFSSDIIRIFREYADGSLILPESPPTTIDDMRRWINQNRDFNEKYDRMVRSAGEFYTREIPGADTLVYK